MVKSQHISWPFWSSRERGARGAGSGSIFGVLWLCKSRVGCLGTRLSYTACEGREGARSSVGSQSLSPPGPTSTSGRSVTGHRDTAVPSVQFHHRTFIPTTDCSVPVPRIGTRALAGASRLSFSLGIGATGSRVPQKSLTRVHAASKPGAARAGLQGSAQTHPRGHYLPPGFDTVL